MKAEAKKTGAGWTPKAGPDLSATPLVPRLQRQRRYCALTLHETEAFNFKKHIKTAKMQILACILAVFISFKHFLLRLGYPEFQNQSPNESINLHAARAAVAPSAVAVVI